MTHLRPKYDNQYLPVEDIVRRANCEFGFTCCDQKRGLRYVAERFLETAAGLSHHEKDHALALVANSIEMIVGDDRQSEEDFLKCYVIPNEPVAIQYVYNGHEERVEPMLVRLANSLEYQICRT